MPYICTVRSYVCCVSIAISSVLLEALMDPSTKTAPCLQVLLQTSFVHFIDAPSLALIMPVLQRALNERSTETKKMASQIIGNMYALTDAKVGYYWAVVYYRYTRNCLNNLIIIMVGFIAVLVWCCSWSQAIFT